MKNVTKMLICHQKMPEYFGLFLCSEFNDNKSSEDCWNTFHMQFKNEWYDTVIDNSIPHEPGIQWSSQIAARGEKEGGVAMGSLRIL